MPKRLLDHVSKNGEVYAVLVGVHRGNVLWYNKKVLEKHNIRVGDRLSFEQFFSAAQKLKAAGLVPLAMGDAGLWATAELFENTLLGVLGPQGWQELFGFGAFCSNVFALFCFVGRGGGPVTPDRFRPHTK